MTRKSESLTIACPPDRKALLEALAIKHGYLWGEKPNVSELIRAIADEEIPLGDRTPQLAIEANVKTVKKSLLKAMQAIEEIEQFRRKS
jgi:hypothetical protein